MITREAIRQEVSDITQRYDPSCYPMKWDEFLELMTCYLYDHCIDNHVKLCDIDQWLFDEIETQVCADYEFRRVEKL